MKTCCYLKFPVPIKQKILLEYYHEIQDMLKRFALI